MEHKNLMENVENLIEKELESARSKFGNINSSHEGYAVILEEHEEMKDEVINFEQNLQSLWNEVKSNNSNKQYEDSIDMEKAAKQIIKEAIQLAAMCKRFHEDLMNK